MHTTGLQEVVQSIMRKTIEEKISSAPATMYFQGESGCGKTATMLAAVQGLSADMGISMGFIPLRLGQMEVGDIIGFPKVVNRNGKDLLTWTLPAWMPSGDYRPCEMCWTRYNCKSKPCNHGVVFLDEPNRMQPDVTQAVFQFIEAVRINGHIEHRLHTHVMPTGFRVFMAGNIETGDYTLTTLDRAFLGRTCQVFVQQEPEPWLQWANGRIDGSIVEFITKHDEYLHNEVKSYTPKVERSGRAWEYLDFIRSCDMDENLKFECYEGLVGTKAAALYVQYCKEHYGKPISAKDVLNNWGKVKKDFLSRDRSSRLMTIDSIPVYLKSIKQEEVNLKSMKNIVTTLIKEEDADLAFNLYKELIKCERKNDKGVPTGGCVREWVRSKPGIDTVEEINKVYDSIVKDKK